MTRLRYIPLMLTLMCFAAFVFWLPARAAEPQQATPPFTGTVIETANLRAGPGTTYDRVGGVGAGQKVQVAACNDDCTWYKLDGGSWIFAELVQAQSSASPAAPDIVPAATAATKATASDNANLRTGPGTSYARAGGVAAGQALDITGRSEAGDWLQLADGTWIAAFLVSSAPANLAASAAVPPAVQPAAEPAVETPAPQPVVRQQSNCDPSYPTVCIPSPPPDLDCGEISYRRFSVVGADPHRFDGDNDGIGCER